MSVGESFRPEAADPKEFRKALGNFATGVTAVTCMTSEGPVGIIANSFASVSLDPPLVLWSPARSSKRFDFFVQASQFAIHVLGQEHQTCCAAHVTGGHDFSTLDWVESESGVPLLKACLARFECDQHAIHDGGDHAIILGRVTRVAMGEGAPMVFAQGAYGRFEEIG